MSPLREAVIIGQAGPKGRAPDDWPRQPHGGMDVDPLRHKPREGSLLFFMLLILGLRRKAAVSHALAPRRPNTLEAHV